MLKTLTLLIIAATPFSRLRIFLYRNLLGYDIDYSCHIGPGNFLKFESCRLSGAVVGKLNFMDIAHCEMEPGSQIRTLNKFLYVNQFRLGGGSHVVSQNSFTGGRPGETPNRELENMFVGSGSFITRKHSFDLADTITVGDDVTFGGGGTEVWTHGFDLKHTRIQAPVEIGSQVYIGSRALILLGVRIVDEVSVGSGAVVSKSIDVPGFYVSGRLERKSDVSDYSESEGVREHAGGRFVKK